MAQTQSRGWLWAAIPVSVLVLSCVGASCGSLIARQEVRTGASPSPAALRSASPSPPPTIVVRLPDSLLGRAKTTDRSLLRSAEQAAAAQQKAQTAAQTVMATYYGSLARKNLVFVLAVQARSSDPDLVYTRVVAAMERQQKGLDLTDVDPGTLGGRAACGEAPVSGSPVTFCLWVDSGSYGFVEFFHVHVGPQRAEFIEARGQIETLV
jgi:hypothetical protein